MESDIASNLPTFRELVASTKDLEKNLAKVQKRKVSAAEVAQTPGALAVDIEKIEFPTLLAEVYKAEKAITSTYYDSQMRVPMQSMSTLEQEVTMREAQDILQGKRGQKKQEKKAIAPQEPKRATKETLRAAQMEQPADTAFAQIGKEEKAGEGEKISWQKPPPIAQSAADRLQQSFSAPATQQQPLAPTQVAIEAAREQAPSQGDLIAKLRRLQEKTAGLGSVAPKSQQKSAQEAAPIPMAFPQAPLQQSQAAALQGSTLPQVPKYVKPSAPAQMHISKPEELEQTSAQKEQPMQPAIETQQAQPVKKGLFDEIKGIVGAQKEKLAKKQETEEEEAVAPVLNPRQGIVKNPSEQRRIMADINNMDDSTITSYARQYLAELAAQHEKGLVTHGNFSFKVREFVAKQRGLPPGFIEANILREQNPFEELGEFYQRGKK